MPAQMVGSPLYLAPGILGAPSYIGIPTYGSGTQPQAGELVVVAMGAGAFPYVLNPALLARGFGNFGNSAGQQYTWGSSVPVGQYGFQQVADLAGVPSCFIWTIWTDAKVAAGLANWTSQSWLHGGDTNVDHNNLEAIWNLGQGSSSSSSAVMYRFSGYNDGDNPIGSVVCNFADTNGLFNTSDGLIAWDAHSTITNPDGSLIQGGHMYTHDSGSYRTWTELVDPQLIPVTTDSTVLVNVIGSHIEWNHQGGAIFNTYSPEWTIDLAVEEGSTGPYTSNYQLAAHAPAGNPSTFVAQITTEPFEPAPINQIDWSYGWWLSLFSNAMIEILPGSMANSANADRFVPQSVVVEWDADTGYRTFKTTVTGNLLVPNINSVIRQIAGQVTAMQNSKLNTPSTNLGDRFVVGGGEGSTS